MIGAQQQHGRATVAKQPERATTAKWQREVVPVDDVDSASARDVQKEFIDLQNAENLDKLLHGNSLYAQAQSVQVRCASIISSALCIVSCCDCVAENTEDNFFIPFTKATTGFLRAGAAQKVAMLDNVVRSCEQLAEQVHEKVCAMRADQALVPATEPLTAKRLCDEQLLQVYTKLLAEIDCMRAMRRQLVLAKTEQAQFRAALATRKRDVFRRALGRTPVTSAPLDPADPLCHVCGSDYAADGSVERLTLACCQHKQSICRQCFTASTYEKSNEGIKSFANCPFCRTEYPLYEEAKRRRIDARRRLDFDSASATSSSQTE